MRDFRIGGVTVRPQLNEVETARGIRHLELKAVSVLVYLAEHAGEVVPRQKLLDAVWEDTFVGEEVLSRAISMLRKALGDRAREPIFIQTIPRRGYRLISPVTWLDDTPAPEQTATRKAPPLPDLSLLAERVREYWIEEFLESELTPDAEIGLRLADLPEAVDPSWGDLAPNEVALPSSSELSTAAYDAELLAAFDRTGGAMLITGAPGAGKTVTLLRLARVALHDRRLPVILNLATWTEQQQPLAEWLGEAIEARYRIAAELGPGWLAEPTLVLLLDGLDELGATNAGSCIAAINHFHRQRPEVALAVSCRTETAINLATEGSRLELERALTVLPLSNEQARVELAPLAGDRTLSSGLQRLARRPLFLGILKRFLANPSEAQLLAEASDEALDRRLLLYYVRTRLRRGAAMGGLDERSSLEHLRRLARAMQRQGKAFLQLDRLQPSWLESTGHRWLYALASRLGIGVSLGLVLGLAVGLARGFLGEPLMAGLVAGITCGLAAGLVDSVVMSNKSRPRWKGWHRLAHVLLLAITATLAATPAVRLLGGSPKPLAAPVTAIILALILQRGRRGLTLDSDIKPVEALVWSWKKLLRRGVLATVTIASLNLTGSLLAGPASSGPGRFGLWFFANPMIFVLALLPLFALRRGTIEGKTRPNHGIWLSARNAGLSLALSAAGMALAIGAALFMRQYFDIQPGFILSASPLGGGSRMVLPMAVMVGGITFLWLGGSQLVKHGCLRLLLAHQGFGPLRLVRFLEHAARCVLLRRSGGGYMFIHRLLLNLLAEEPRDGKYPDGWRVETLSLSLEELERPTHNASR